MNGIIYKGDTVTLVGGGGARPLDIVTATKRAPTLIAADGGAADALSAGFRPSHVIGDLDSLPEAARADLADVLVHVTEQSTTDFEKCLVRIAVDLVIAVGFLGGRIDHQLAVLNTLARHADRRIVLLGADDAAMVVPGTMQIDLPAGTRLSLMPLGTARVWTSGLRWNLAGDIMRPDGFVSISNEVAGAVTIRAEGPVLVAVPPAYLDALI